MATEDTVNTIINNALELSQQQTSAASAAAAAAVTAAMGYASASVPNITYELTAVEPAVLDVEDSTLTYEAQLERLMAILTAQLAAFFTEYYPLATDAFDEATNWLVNAITVGGTGISPAVEEQIWQRARDRIIADGARVEADTMSEFADRGFSLPSGTLVSKLQELRFEQLAKSQDISRDIAADQAKMEVENVRFAVDLAIKSRLQALDAAANYLRATLSGADVASRVAGLNSDARSRMVAATAELYRARIARDEVAMKVPMANTDKSVQLSTANMDGFYKGVANRVQATMSAADVYGRSAAAALASLNSVASVSSAAFS
jgi:hypothetical protein